MADPRFFDRAGPFSLGELASRVDAELAPSADPATLVQDVAPIDVAGPEHLSFLDNKKYADAFAHTKAGAVIVHPSMASKAPEGVALLLAADPYRSYAKAARAFYPPEPVVAWVSPLASVDPSAILAEGVRVEAGAVIGPKAEIGKGCLIGPNVVIGRGVVLGEDCRIGANSSISHALLGNRVTLYPGVCVGQDGFGFAMGPQGHLTVPQLGRVIIEDDVDVGANSTIDRGAGPDTVIGAGSKIDNLVQIGHNVRMGRGCVMVAQSGISGSTHLGNFVVVAGQVGIAGHLTLGDGAQVAAKSGVMRDVEPGGKVGGYPAVQMKDWLRQTAILGQVARKKDR
jgi:UDP-3-O-[3-hydroxymyristoyl] glucosamine N-acyltransferase